MISIILNVSPRKEEIPRKYSLGCFKGLMVKIEINGNVQVVFHDKKTD